MIQIVRKCLKERQPFTETMRAQASLRKQRLMIHIEVTLDKAHWFSNSDNSNSPILSSPSSPHLSSSSLLRYEGGS